MDLRKGILRNLHSVFDREPQERVAFHLTHSSGVLSWILRSYTLSIDAISGTIPSHTYDLSVGTVGNIIERLRLDGYECTFVDDSITARPARSLLDAESSFAIPEERLSVFDAPLWAAMSGPGRETELLSSSLDAMIEQLDFSKATGSWLDLWGFWLDVPRRPGMQDDAVYAAFIAEEVTRGRSNNHAIESAIKAWTGKDVVIREPWKELMILDKSKFGVGDTYLQDGNFYTFGTIQPRGNVTPDEWALIEYIVDRNRSLGCYRLPSAFDPGVIGIVLGEIAVGVSLVVILSYRIDVGAITVPSFAWGEGFHSELIELAAEGWTGTWDTRTWADSSSTISIGYNILTEDSATCLCP